ncbi:rod shape-determining protein [Dactylosporangium sp. NPDC048998]|uniref:rod shape-determining protein n=1 Tax=Dactylosporangium sp. NPDC048998 TaxID=3363976 RepID=UPI0037160C1A
MTTGTAPDARDTRTSVRETAREGATMINNRLGPALALGSAATTQRPARVALGPDAGPATAGPTAIGLDIGSAYTRIWASGRPMVHARTGYGPAAYGPIRHGRITDPATVHTMLTGLCAGDARRPSPGAIVVACRPAQTAAGDEQALRQTIEAALAPKRLLFIDTVRAAAIGSGAPAGPLLVVDVGVELVEAAVLARGVVVALRHELDADAATGLNADDMVAAAVIDLLQRLRRLPLGRQAAAAAERRGLLLVGGGATRPRLAAQIAAAVDVPVCRPAAPHLVAARGAGLAALAALRRAAMCP